MLFDLWWVYVVGAGLAAVVVFQAWERRRSAKRGARQEQGRVERDAARYAEGHEYAEQARRSMKS